MLISGLWRLPSRGSFVTSYRAGGKGRGEGICQKYGEPSHDPPVKGQGMAIDPVTGRAVK